MVAFFFADVRYALAIAIEITANPQAKHIGHLLLLSFLLCLS